MRDYTPGDRGVMPVDPSYDVRDGMPGSDRAPMMPNELQHARMSSYYKGHYPYGYSGRYHDQMRANELMHGYRHASRTGAYGASAVAGSEVPQQLNLDVILDCFAGHDMLDEIDVSQKYLDYYCALKRDNQLELADQVAEMAYEEFTHAKFQKEVLMDHGVPVSPEVLGAYSELKERMERMFRSTR